MLSTGKYACPIELTMHLLSSTIINRNVLQLLL